MHYLALNSTYDKVKFHVTTTVCSNTTQPGFVLYLTHVSDFIGFSSFATNDLVLVSGDVIDFPGVVTNSGDSYNPETSTFTCPTTAYYYIYFNVAVYMNYHSYQHCEIKITMDDTEIAMVSAR